LCPQCKNNKIKFKNRKKTRVQNDVTHLIFCEDQPITFCYPKIWQLAMFMTLLENVL
jgi:hypothetical protein